MEIYRGDIFYVMKGGYTTGSEQETGRPAVIVSNNSGNHFSSIVEVVYLTTADKKPLPTHASIICKVPSTALCEQVSSVSKDRLGEFIKSCTLSEMKAIDRALAVSLALDEGDLTAISDAKAELAAECDELKKKLEAAKEQISQLEKVDSVMVNNSFDGKAVLKLKTERDLYKKLYEQTLDKLIS